MHRFSVLILALSLSQCAFRSPQGVTLRVRAEFPRGERALADMSCFIVSITGQGISNLPHPFDGCVSLGTHPAPVSLAELRSGVTVENVSLGARNIDIVGVRTSGTCPTSAQTLLEQWPDLYEVANTWSGEIGASETVRLTETSDPGTREVALPCRIGGRFALGASHVCYLKNGVMKCWGNNDDGQLGAEHTFTIGDEPGEMGGGLISVQLGTGRTAKQIAGGQHHNCAVLDDNTVKCWGNNLFGYLGVGHTTEKGSQPGEMGDSLGKVELGTGRTAKQVALGYTHSCALLDDGSVKCWGRNNMGQLGQGHTNSRGDEGGEMGDALDSVDLGSGRTAKQISCGNEYTCALLDNGSVKCWGVNAVGQLGQGHNNTVGDDPGEIGDALPPIDLGQGRTARQIWAGFTHACALLDDRSFKCWGYNNRGQLGQGHVNTLGDEAGEMGDSLSAINLGAGRYALRVTVGWEYTCALLDDHSVKCWGHNQQGQLGLGHKNILGNEAGEMGDNLATLSFGQGRTVKDLAQRTEHSCVLLDNDAVKCWGQNNAGALGQEHMNDIGDDAGEMGDSLLALSLGSFSRSALSLVRTPTPSSRRHRKRN